MKVAVFSDMHGNCMAFDAVLAAMHADPADRYVCLGDTVQGGPQPHETLARLRELGCPVVIGNADGWLLTGQNLVTAEPPPTQQMEDIREWTLSTLDDDDIAF